MSIEWIRLKNFQKHEEKTISFSSGVNVIVGHTNSGKSAIIRALKWICLHESKKYLTTHGKAELEVEISTGSLILKRFSHAHENGYVCNGKKLVALGTTQPEEITQQLRIQDINFQSQHDSHFLLSLTPGTAAKQINKLVDLESIDIATAWLQKQREQLEDAFCVEQESLTQNSQELDTLDWVPGHIAAFDAVCEKENKIENQQKYADSLESILEAITPLESYISSFALLADDLFLFLGSVTAGVSSLHLAKSSILGLERILQNIVECETVDYLVASERPLTALLKAARQELALSEIVSELFALESKLDIGTAKEKEAETALTRIRKTVVCPMCKKPLDTPPASTSV